MQRWALQTHYMLWHNTASIMKDLNLNSFIKITLKDLWQFISKKVHAHEFSKLKFIDVIQFQKI